MFHRLRIVASVLFAVACLAICVLWLQSYYRFGQADLPLSKHYGMSIQSVRGQLCIWAWENDNDRVHVWTTSIEEWLGRPPIVTEQLDFPPHEGLRVSGRTVLMPHWFAAFVFALLTIGLWLSSSRRFTLRTLFIAVTLIAIALGLASHH